MARWAVFFALHGYVISGFIQLWMFGIFPPRMDICCGCSLLAGVIGGVCWRSICKARNNKLP